MNCPPPLILPFAREVLAHRGLLLVRVEGGSMAPCVIPGDQVLLGPGPPSLGDIVAFSSGSGLITHRYVGRWRSGGQRYLITKGDASFLCDRPVPEEAVVGKALAIIRGERRIFLRRRSWRIGGWIIALSSRGIGTLYSLYIRMRKGPHAPV